MTALGRNASVEQIFAPERSLTRTTVLIFHFPVVLKPKMIGLVKCLEYDARR